MEDKIKEIIEELEILKTGYAYHHPTRLKAIYITQLVISLKQDKEYKHKYTCDSCGEVTRSDKPIIKCCVCSGESTEADKTLDFCVWGKIEDFVEVYSYFETTCQQEFVFNEGGVSDNDFKYCPFCGKKIKQAMEG